MNYIKYAVADRVKQTATVSGAGDVTIPQASGLITGYSPWYSGISPYMSNMSHYCGSNLNTLAWVPYLIENSDGSEWEVGYGVVIYDGTNIVLKRLLPKATNTSRPTGSSYTVAPLAFAAGSKTISLVSTSSGASHTDALVDRKIVLYVDNAGDDGNNNGLTVGSPLATLQRAIEVAAHFTDVTINLAAGSFGGATIWLPYGENLTLFGDSISTTTTTSDIYIGDIPDASVGGYAKISPKLRVYIAGIALTSSAYGLWCSGEFTTYVNGVLFGSCASGHMLFENGARGYHMENVTNSINGGCSAGAHLKVTSGGRYTYMPGAMTQVWNSITLSQGFARAAPYGGTIDAYNFASSVTGTVTGTKYYAQGGSVIYVGGRGASVFPGATAGSVANNGVYF